MRARYIGTEDPTDDQVCGVFGQSFSIGEWVDVSAELGKRLSTNPTFEIDTNDDGEVGPTVDELRAQLDELGVEYRANAGVKKLTELLDAATAPATEGEGA